MLRYELPVMLSGINLEPGKIFAARVNERSIRLPEGFVNRPAKSGAKERIEAGIAGAVRQLLKKSGHMSGHGRKHLRIFEGKAQGAVAAHGDAADGASSTRAGQAKLL